MAQQIYRAQAKRLNEMKRLLQNVLDSFHESPEKIAEMLAFKNRFWTYSFNNSILIQQQNPFSTYVASLRDWNKKGYRVKKGQHGIKILFPIRTELIPIDEADGQQRYRRVADATPEEKQKIRDGELKTVTFTRFGIGNVFDISQTDCPPEKYPKFYDMGYSSGQHAALYRTVKQFAESKGIPVREVDLHSISLRGAFYPEENTIRISDKLNDTERLSTLTHELGHALMHRDPKGSSLPVPVKEIEADSISIMLQQYFGISLTDSRKSHFADTYKDCLKLKTFSLEDMLKQVNATYQDLRKELEPELAKMPEVAGVTPKKSDEPQQTEHSRPEDRRDREADLDSIKRSVSLVGLAQAMGFTPVRQGRYYTLKEHDSVKIYPETNSFCQFSSGKGGSPVDFLMAFGGYTKKEAIEKLENEHTGGRFNGICASLKGESVLPPEKKEFILPEKVQGKYARAFAYLTKTRCIDAAIVKQCMNNDLIYEDNRHNVVFVGLNDSGKAVYATRHTTLTSSDFKRDIAGSRQDVGWMVKNPKAEKLYVCEAPIDALSIMTLLKQQGKPVEKASYLATGGTCKDAALYTRLRENPQIREVCLANDNDGAGKKANEKIFAALQKNFPELQVKQAIPNSGKDINECLCQEQKKEAVKGQEVER